MLRCLFAFCLALLIVLMPPRASTPQPEAKNDVILHAFDWSYSTVAERATAIAKAGYGAVLVTPPLKSPITPQCRWYQRYQPQDLRVIDNCDGNKESFVAMVKALNAVGVLTYADVVVNHMANERSGATTFPGDTTLQQYREERDYWQRQRLYGDLDQGLFSPQDFHPPHCIRDYDNRHDVIHGRICGGGDDPGLPDLNDTNPENSWVIHQRQHYVQSLYDLGVRGFRIDAAKHMPTAAIQALIPDQVRNNVFIFAEIITGGGTDSRDYGLFLAPYLQTLPPAFAAYDFPLLNAIKQAFSYGHSLSAIAHPEETGNALDSARAVTVVTTHDIPYNAPFRSWILDPVDEELAYAYILGRAGGTPMVFDDGTTAAPPFGQIDQGRWQRVWNSDRITKMIAFHNQMRGTSMDVLYTDHCTLVWQRGNRGIAAINKCNTAKSIGIKTQLTGSYLYQDLLADNTPLEIHSPSLTLALSPRSAHLWTRD